MYDIENINNYLKNNLSEFRYNHSLMVAEEARKLARNYKYDEEKAYVAGLIHDIAKEFTEEENKRWIKKYNLSKDLLKPEYKRIIHADIGALVAKEYYNLDEDICNAIRYHTIGNINMDILAKITFIADKIGRANITPNIKKYKDLAYIDLDKAILLYLEDGEKILYKKGLHPHPEGIKLLNYLKDIKK